MVNPIAIYALIIPKNKPTLFKLFSFFCFLLLSQFSGSLLASSSIFKESLESIQSKALQGDSYYQGVLSLFYKYGEKGLSIQLREAERWAKTATKNGSGIGMATLASIHLEKGNFDRSQFLYDEAYLHSNLRELAKSKNPFALFCLGLMEIDHPPKNTEKGIRNILESANKGFPTAQATLGVIYLSGSGHERDVKRGVMWCSRAARQKNPLAMFYLGLAYIFGDGVSKNEDYANRWVRAAADRGLVSAQLTLGMRLSMGDGIERNLKHGVAWLKKAALNDSEEAKVQLRRFQTLLKSPYKNSDIDDSKSNKYEYKQSNLVNLDKKEDSSEILLNRKEGLKNYQNKKYANAQEYFLKGFKMGDPTSIRYLGIMNFLGQGVPKNNTKAKDYLQKAVQAGDIEAKKYLNALKRL